MSGDADSSTWNKQHIFQCLRDRTRHVSEGDHRHDFLQQQRTELSDPAHPSLCAQSCFKQLVIAKKHSKARQPSYSVVLFQFKFKPQYQSEETPKLRHVCLSCPEFNHRPEQPSTILISSTRQSPGYSFALALLSLIQIFVSSNFQTFCQPGSPVGNNSAQCWRRNLKFHPGGESYILEKTCLSVHTSVTAQQESLHIGLKDSLICCLFSHLPVERDCYNAIYIWHNMVD